MAKNFIHFMWNRVERYSTWDYEIISIIINLRFSAFEFQQFLFRFTLYKHKIEMMCFMWNKDTLKWNFPIYPYFVVFENSFTRCAYLSVAGNIYVCTCFQSITFRFCQLFAFYSQLRIGGKNPYTTQWKFILIQTLMATLCHFHREFLSQCIYILFSFQFHTIYFWETHTAYTLNFFHFLCFFFLKFRFVFGFTFMLYICFCFHLILYKVIWSEKKIELVNFCM